jgi:hypothetical protein
MGFGYGIRKKPIPDPGSKGQKGTVYLTQVLRAMACLWLFSVHILSHPSGLKTLFFVVEIVIKS